MRDELLIACSLKATVILIVGSGLSFALSRASAAVRHLLWTIAFTALLLMPVESAIAPKWPIMGYSALPEPAQADGLRQLSTHPATPVRPGIDWLPTVWVAGAALVLARFGVGTARVWLRTRRAKTMAIPAGRATVLDAGPRVMPMTWGALRP